MLVVHLMILINFDYSSALQALPLEGYIWRLSMSPRWNRVPLTHMLVKAFQNLQTEPAYCDKICHHGDVKKVENQPKKERLCGTNEATNQCTWI